MSELTRRSFGQVLGIIFGTVATSAPIPLGNILSDPKEVKQIGAIESSAPIEVSDRDPNCWLTVSALLSDKGLVEGQEADLIQELERYLVAGFRARKSRPIGKPRLRKERRRLYCGWIYALDQHGRK